jgi:flagellar basal body P-ring formation protein FlgA
VSHRILAAAAVLASAPAWAGSPPEAMIELLPQVRVSAGAVTLGQVARLASNDLDLMRSLVNLRIGRSPAAGQSVTLERDALKEWIRLRLRVAPEQVRWSGPESAQVIARSRAVAGEEIAVAAGDALRHWLAARSDRNEVQLHVLPRDIEAPEGEVRLATRPLANSRLRKRMLVWVDVWVSDRFVRTVPVSFDVSAWREAAEAIAPLEAGAALPMGALSIREVDVAAEDGPPAMVETLGREAFRTRRALQPGELVKARDVEGLPAVLRGQWASLRSGAGAVTLEARVEVLQDGRPGDRVRVRQPGATAAVVAKVIAPGQLEVVQ